MDIENSAFLDDYKILKTLGQGYHAKVKLAQRGNEAPVALKIFKKTHAFEKNKEALLKEFQSMQGLDHPNLIKLIDIKPNAVYKKKNGQQYNSMAIVLEFAGAGELFEYVSTCGRYDEQTTRTYFQQLVNGLQYIHNAGICHRDLKPENLLYDKDFVLKIADFGFATAIAGKDGDGYLSTILGTESYMCPEIHQRVKYEGASADLFAAGIILFIILTGHPPFMKADPKDPYYKLLTVNKHSTFWKAHSKNKPGKEAFFSDEIKNLFNAMFAYQPGQRATLEEIRSHAWYNGPTKSMQEIKSEFLKRQQAVEKELEAQRIQKQQEKAQQQGNYVFAGVGKFRSGDEVTDEFAGLDSKFTNIGNQRNMKGYFQQPGKTLETFTAIDPEYLLKLILQNADQYSTETTVKDDSYKIKFNFTDSNGVSTKYNVEFLKKDEDITCVDFQKISGSSIDFFTQTEKIKKLIQNGKIEQEGQPQEA